MSIAVIPNNKNTKCTKKFSLSTTTTTTTTTTATSIDSQRKHVIKRKVIAIGKLSKSYNVLKEHAELVQQLKTLSTNGKLPIGILATGEQGIREAIVEKTAALNNNNNNNLNKIKEEKENMTLHYHQPTPNTITSREGGHI
ncbi:uncharacterized protein BX663DRAFT_560857 [Cokeromyces recurvatus]|uniref:uncharacterized protein n=1 Tax=Cokeromyces recurvatus TaxID=90255 RepID=UPI002220F617|nr:uncharacterized protein BX663DRAFT_560857 [Cokeromyces recurvatus]KAI7903345.1 hypothetical protein BX663DRAFT_560857 [Cokeromyces recurvatus]